MRAEPRPRTPRSPTRFLPPLLWMGLIALGSSSLLSGDQTRGWVLVPLGQVAPWASPATLAVIHLLLRKLGHVIEYGILAVLWHRALGPAPMTSRTAFVLATAYGGLDELWQGLLPSRTPAVSDVVVDATGALLGLAAWTGHGLLIAAMLRGAVWGAGLLGGLTALGVVVDATLGRPVGDAGVAAVGLGLVAGGLTRLARHPRTRAPQAPGPPAAP